jgi:hypothetical protein
VLSKCHLIKKVNEKGNKLAYTVDELAKFFDAGSSLSI